MEFLVEAQYRFFSPTIKKFIGPVIDKVKLKVNSQQDVEDQAKQQIQKENGVDQLFDWKIFTIIEV